MLKAIIFDMDGVLINSTPYVRKSFEKILKENGLILSEGYDDKMTGMSLKSKMTHWKNDFGFEYDIQDFSNRATEMQIKLMTEAGEFNKNTNLIDFIENAKKANLKLAVATSSMKERSLKFLELLGIQKFFDEVITAEDVEKHKPNPDIFLKAAAKLNIEPKGCIVIEDAINGIEAAHKAGMKVVGKVTSIFNESDLSIADLVINDFSELSIEKLKQLLKIF